MSDVEPRRSAVSNFSLWHLLIFTTLIAVGIALGLAYRKNLSLTQQRDALRTLSSRLHVAIKNNLVSAAMPDVADDFHSWQVHVPEGQQYELRLGIGEISEKGIPPVVARVPLAAGEHRVTLHTADSTSEQFRYVVYLDGIQVIEKAMGSDWIPRGWSSASGMNWPRGSQLSPPPLQLAAQGYTPNRDFGVQNYFSGQGEAYVTQFGYRLWIDHPDRTYQPPSPFMGFPDDPQYIGVGLRDGLRYCPSFSSPYQWTFSRPSLATTNPVLRIEAEFFANDGTILSSQTSQIQSFQSWKIRDASSGTDSLQWKDDPSKTTQSAFLHATFNSNSGLQPVIEMKWDVAKPDEVGIRLADTPANAQISRWRLRILDGAHHLWRELKLGDRHWITPNDVIASNTEINANDANNAEKVLDESSVKATRKTTELDLGDAVEAASQLQWQTNEALPLQIVERSQNGYAGLGLYKGLPVTLGIRIPSTLKAKLAVDIADQSPNAPGTAFPSGPVFDAIQIELEATERDWIWLNAKAKE